MRLDRDVVLEDRYVLTRPPLLAIFAVLLLSAAAVWVFASRSGTDPAAEEDSLTSGATTTTQPSPTTASAPPTSAPVNGAPVAAAPATTVASTTTTVPETTTSSPVPTTSATVSPGTGVPAIVVPVTEAPITAAPVLMPPPQPGPIDEGEAIAFVLTYYEQVGAGEYDASWPKLSQEFRDDRNLNFGRYTRYWRNTWIEIGELQYTPGPGVDEGRVRFAARYTTGGRVVDETDELTLQRQDDGLLVITEQRIVS